MTLTLRGKVSTFGGPDDGPSTGNRRDDWKTEGLALFDSADINDPLSASLFLHGGELLPGLARRLNPERFYVAARWNYDRTPKEWLRRNMVIVTNPATGKRDNARQVDWGPAERTGRAIDISPGLARFLGLQTDDEAELAIAIGDVEREHAYLPFDPRDSYKNQPGINSDHPRPGLPPWLVLLGAVLTAYFAGLASGKGWLGILLDIVRRLGA